MKTDVDKSTSYRSANGILYWPKDRKQIILSALAGAGAALAFSAVLIGIALFLDARFPLS